MQTEILPTSVLKQSRRWSERRMSERRMLTTSAPSPPLLSQDHLFPWNHAGQQRPFPLLIICTFFALPPDPNVSMAPHVANSAVSVNQQNKSSVLAEDSGYAGHGARLCALRTRSRRSHVELRAISGCAKVDTTVVGVEVVLRND